MTSCGYCKPCIQLRIFRNIGRDPEHQLECSYKHILESYDPLRLDSGSNSQSSSSCSSPSSSTMSTPCPWTSPNFSSEPFYDDPNFSYNGEDDYIYSRYPYKKRVHFTKKKKVERKK